MSATQTAPIHCWLIPDSFHYQELRSRPFLRWLFPFHDVHMHYTRSQFFIITFREKAIWKSLGSQFFFRPCTHSLQVSGKYPVSIPSQITCSAKTLRRQEIWRYIKISVSLFDDFFRSKQFCDAANHGNCSSTDSELNSLLKPAQFFMKVNVSYLCVSGIRSMIGVETDTSFHYFAPHSVVLFPKSKTREQYFSPCFEPTQRHSHKNYRAALQLHQYD